MERSEKVGALMAALVAAQTEMITVAETKQAHGYKYADLATILQSVKPVLKRHELAVVQTVGGSGAAAITTMLGHASGEYIADTYTLPILDEGKRMNSVQAMGAAITYGRRYGLTAILGLAADEDTDAASPKPVTKPTKPAPPKYPRLAAATANMPEDEKAHWRTRFVELDHDEDALLAEIADTKKVATAFDGDVVEQDLY